MQGGGRGDVLVAGLGGGGDGGPLLLKVVHDLGCLLQVDVDILCSVSGKVPRGDRGSDQPRRHRVEVAGLVGDVAQDLGAGNGTGQFQPRVSCPSSQRGLELLVRTWG